MGTWRRRFSAARAGDPAEFAQGQLRVIINVMIVLYFVAAILWDRVLDDRELALLAVLAVLQLWVAGYLSWLLLRPGVNPWRRRTGIVVDLTEVVLIMVLGREAGLVLYVMFLWIPTGNGFRFGRPYLHFAQALAVVGFVAVLLLSDLWAGHATLGAALLLVLIVIPAYVSALLGRLNASNRRLQEARGEAEAANVAKTKFLAAASHDLRQPMQALSVYASVLEERVSGADALRVVRGVQLSVRTLEQLFDGLLDIARIESGVIRPGVVAFPIAPLIEQVVEAERPMAEHKNLQLRWVSTSASVRSDPLLLERMLKNLVTNAVRYTERGGIVVGCRRAGPCLRLQVADSGAGIPVQEQERIFEEYYQLAGSSTQGLGLGLPIVKSLAELLGHKVSVKSAPGRGSVFSIDLERAAEAPAADRAAELPAAALGGATVVVVDDDAEIRESMRLLVESWGGRCIAGASAADVEGKLRAAGEAPAALIADYRLADAMNGLQVIGRLRAAF
ncbi:MAG TPA: hybrid sensor histidine kinase/response regulator, partial [Burkholderiales bacterium]